MRRSTLIRLLGFLGPYRGAAVSSVLLAALEMGVTVAIPWLTGLAVDVIARGDRGGARKPACAAGRIVVLDGGQIAEQGTHDELLAAQGAYWRLYRDWAEQPPSMSVVRVASA